MLGIFTIPSLTWRTYGLIPWGRRNGTAVAGATEEIYSSEAVIKRVELPRDNEKPDGR